MMPYHDKNGTEIKEGMFLVSGNGHIEKVYATMDADGNPDLGINASNDAYLHRQYPGMEEAYREFYPLSKCELKDMMVCSPEQTEGHTQTFGM